MWMREERILRALYDAREALISEKPAERSELARGYAITITELEKVIGYFKTFVIPFTAELTKKESDDG